MENSGLEGSESDFLCLKAEDVEVGRVSGMRLAVTASMDSCRLSLLLFDGRPAGSCILIATPPSLDQQLQ